MFTSDKTPNGWSVHTLNCLLVLLVLMTFPFVLGRKAPAEPHLLVPIAFARAIAVWSFALAFVLNLLGLILFRRQAGLRTLWLQWFIVQVVFFAMFVGVFGHWLSLDWFRGPFE